MQQNCIEFNVNVTDDVLNRLPECLSSFCQLSDEPLEGVNMILNFQKLNDESLEAVFDGGLLLGEIFRCRYPESTWRICRSPLSSVDYGQPVLANDEFATRYVFAPIRTIHGKIGSILLNKPREWPLSRHFEISAAGIGLGVPPLASDGENPG
jgi:hypothetical protein